MPTPRKSLVSKSDTPYYHCVSRCVRRAFLCGHDNHSGKSYEHRRQWIVERLHLVASVFAIDICAYAIMSNHYHLVLRLGSSRQWTDQQVIARWLLLFQGPLLARRLHAGDHLSEIQRQTVTDIAKVWRSRLEDLSWFMKCLNEPIARQANSEDQCSGHFWEARFKSQALRTESALLACMAYVDLNPVRAGMAKTPEESDFTSLQLRLCRPVSRRLQKALREAYPFVMGEIPAKPLLAFSCGNQTIPDGIPFSFEDYAQLVDWTGRQQKPGKRGYIASRLPPILLRLSIEPEQWLINSQRFEHIYHRRFGKVA